MSGEITGAGNVSPEDMKAYKREFSEGVDIFDESLKAYSQVKKFPEKKAELRKSMDEAKKVLDQVGPLMSSEIKKQKAALDTDYKTFLSNENPDSYQKLEADVTQLKESVSE